MAGVLELADLAAEQWGLISTAQARSVGVSAQSVAYLANHGALERVTHGVHRLTGAPPSPLDDLRAAWIALDPSLRVAERLQAPHPAVVSHRTAASIHRLGDLEADEFEFAVAERKQTRRQGVRLHREIVGRDDWTIVDGLPVTTVLRTVADLAASRIDGGHLASVVRDALTRHHVDDKRLADALRVHAHHYGAPIGDGEGLLARFLQEAGVSQSLGRAVEMSGAGTLTFGGDTSRHEGEGTRQLRLITEQLQSIQRALEPTARLSQQMSSSPAMKAAREAVESGNRIGASSVAKAQAALARSAAVSALTELVNSPAMKEIANRYAEVARVAELANAVAETTRAAQTLETAIAVPEVAAAATSSPLEEYERGGDE